MDFSNAPIAVADVDELSCTGESDHTELPPDGVLKRSLSDPFDISGGLQLEASLERLIWTFDENVSHVPLDSPNLNDKDGSRNHANNKVTLDAIKSFWRISVSPIENPRESYPLEKKPITFDMEDLHMADAESVSEAEFEAFSPNADILLERERLARERLERLQAGEDDVTTTDSTGPISATSWESISNSSSSLNGKSPPHLPPTMPHLLADWDQTTRTFSEDNGSLEWTPVPDVSEDRTLENNLRRAELQAALEAFKAKHPTLPLSETSDWKKDLNQLSPALLQHYANELEMETGRVSEQLINCLAEREELRLFREALDRFVVLHNALQHRRRKAAEAVLANTTRSTLAHLKQNLSHSVLYRRMPRSTSPGSMVELNNFSIRGDVDDSLGGSTVSLNLRPPEVIERMPRGAHIGDPIEFPSLRSALSKLSGLIAGQSTVQGKRNEETIRLASRVVADEENAKQLADSNTIMRLVEGAKRSGSKLPPINLPWPMGRPEYSHTLKLQIPIPFSKLSNWLPPRLPIINEILLAALQESPELKRLQCDLIRFDPLLEAQRLQRTSMHLSKSGFESAQVDSMQILYSSNDNVGGGDSAPRKTVSFDWRGTKVPFKDLADKQNGAKKNGQPSQGV